MTQGDVAQRPAHPKASGPSNPPQPTLRVRLLGRFGAALIGVALLGARAWARITRTPYYRD